MREAPDPNPRREAPDPEPRREAPDPDPGRPAALVDPDLVEAARILRGALVRVHPSFRFEERLAGRLAAAAEAAVLSGAALRAAATGAAATGASAIGTGARDLIPFRGSGRTPVRSRAGTTSGLSRMPRSVLIGGAIASGVTLAGAAFLARRWRARPPRSPFARATRAAHRAAAGREQAVGGGFV